MGKKNEELDKLTEMADELIADENHDRERLSDFFDKLLSTAEGSPAELGEIVAKIAEAMTRQSVARLNTIKILKKSAAGEETSDSSEAFEQIGKPFEEDRGGN